MQDTGGRGWSVFSWPPASCPCILNYYLRIERRYLLRVDAQILHGVRDTLAVALALFFELVEGGQRDEFGIHLEVAAERAAAFAAAHAVGAEHVQAAWHPFADLLGQSANIVRRCNARAIDAFERPLDVGNARRLCGMQ